MKASVILSQYWMTIFWMRRFPKQNALPYFSVSLAEKFLTKIISLDGTPTLKGNHILGFGFWMNKNFIPTDGEPDTDIESIMVRLLQKEDRSGATEDAKFIIDQLAGIYNNFDNVAKKIKFVGR